MSIFIYDGMNQRQIKVKGEIEADSEVIARVSLQKQGILIANIRPKRSSNLNIGGRIKPMHIAMVARQLATMTTAGVPLVQAFGIMIEGLDHPKLQKLLTKVKLPFATD